MKVLKELLINPAEVVARAKKKKDIDKVSLLLTVEWILIGLGIVIVFSNLGYLSRLALAITVFLIGIPSVLLFALLLKIVITTLGGKGSYYEGLSSITYGMFAVSIGILVSSPFFYIPAVGFLFGLLILIVAGALSIATFYRAVKELFTIDMITTWVGIGLSATGIAIGIYLTLIFLLGEIPEFFRTLETMKI